MMRKCRKPLLSILCCVSAFVFPASMAFADDCGPGSSNPSNPTCLPGTYVNDQIQQQQRRDAEAAAAAVQAQAQRDADSKKQMEETSAAADPRNQSDPASPYYLGTPAQQCEAAKHSLFCTLGFACAPDNIDCAQIGSRHVSNHHRRAHD